MNIKDKKLKLIIFATVMILAGFGLGKEVLAAPSWTNGIVPLSGGVQGGGALYFDGTDDYVDVGDVGSIQTVEFWINDSNATDGILELVDNTNYISISSSAILLTGLTGSKTYVNGQETSTLASGWNHIVATFNAISATSFRIGEANSDYLDGKIDEVKVYNRALSQEEVRYHYNKGGPVSHWKMNEGEGRIVYDSTESNNDGTLVLAGSATSSAWATGKYGSALNFDGVDDYVQAASSGYSLEKAFTIAYWVKLDALPDVGGPGVGQYGYNKELSISTNGKVLFESRATAAPYLVFYSQKSLSIGSWYYLTGTFIQDGAKMVGNIYINGALDNFNSVVNTPHNTEGNAVRIGTQVHNFADYLDGTIDDVKIYNYARTPEQIRLDYNNGLNAHFK